MLYFTAISNKKWPINDTTGGKMPSDTDVHKWESERRILTTTPIIPGDLGTSLVAGNWAIDYDNIIVVDTQLFEQIVPSGTLADNDILRSITRKIGSGTWPIIIVDEGDTKLERAAVVERVVVQAQDPFPHSTYRYTLFTLRVDFVNNASISIDVPYDLIWNGDDSMVGRVCHGLYRDHNFDRSDEFTDEEFTKIKLDLEASGIDFDVKYLDGNQRVIRFYTNNLDGYPAWYQNRLDPSKKLYDIDISRQIKDAEGTYGIIRKREHRHPGGHKQCHPDNLTAHAYLAQSYTNQYQKAVGAEVDGKVGEFKYDCSTDIYR